MTDDTRHAELMRKLSPAGQQHLLRWWPELGERGRRRLAAQIDALDLDQLPVMREAIAQLDSPPVRKLSPAPVYALSEERFPWAPAFEAQAVTRQGEQALAEGRVACLLVAGGQGTRLGFDGPKGCFPVLPLSGMTLFEAFCRKLRRAGRDHGRTPPLYVMVGSHNHGQTREFFEDHEFFGLKPADVVFFEQGSLPAMDADGRLILEAKDRLFLGPDGHGGVLKALRANRLLADMRTRGVETVSYFQVDNVQVPPVDPAFLGLHIEQGAEVSLKVVRKTDPDERVGIYCLDDGVPGIVEYTEFRPEESRLAGPDGRLAYWAGSIAVHAFQVDFLERLAQQESLPLHAAHKKVPCLNDDGDTAEPQTPNAWKFERFIFDALPFASTVAALEVPREEQFLPLKNPDGPFGPDGVRQSLHDYWLRAVRAAAPGAAVEEIEVDPLLCENARELIQGLRASPRLDRIVANGRLHLRDGAL